ncbi:copper-translocating P-type ATPase [Bacillus sp. 1P06AnD]|uniref:copper-translocating P-type ATPase n=1 Tax=Bacillus sp. 1P06AnD TaxID=3132208 RepID=UPI00399FB42C
MKKEHTHPSEHMHGKISRNEDSNHDMSQMDHSHSHGGHEGHDHMAMIADFKKRFWVTLVLSIPVIILSQMIQMFFHYSVTFPGDSIIQLVLATLIFFYGGWPFLKGMADELKGKSPGMMTLIGFAITVAYIYSAATVFGIEGTDFFWELATLIAIMLLGHWIEMKSVMKASDSLSSLVKLIPQNANKLMEDGRTETIPAADLQKGDQLLIKPGEKIPADSIIEKGTSSIDESMLTGESIPVKKGKGDQVIGGSVNTSGSLTVKVTKGSNDGYLAQIVQLVEEAQKSKSKTQVLSDKAAKLLFYVAVLSGVVTLIVWLALGYSFGESMKRMVTVLVISCPHALGLAIPLVVARSTAIAAQKGLFIRNRIGFEDARKINTMIFDKTGTLTEGKFGVTDMIPAKGVSEEELLYLAGSLESNSEHPIASGISAKVKERNIELSQPEEFDSLTGEGISGLVDGRQIKVVNPGYLDTQNINYDAEKLKTLSAEGKTVVSVIENKAYKGMIALADSIKESAKEAIGQLKNMNIDSIMLTGDNQQVAERVGKTLGINHVIAEVLPDEKANEVKKVKATKKKVGMTGDGINDAPALANADLSVAVGAGTDVAMETADVVLVNSNPKDIVSIISLSKSTYRKMIQNLWWAAGYNIIAIPLAAGVLAPLGIIMDPAVGAVLMSLSTVIVAINARSLKHD